MCLFYFIYKLQGTLSSQLAYTIGRDEDIQVIIIILKYIQNKKKKY